MAIEGVDPRAGEVAAATPPAVAPGDDVRTVRLVDYRPTVRESLREAWHERHLVPALAANVMMLAFKRTYLGPGWIVIQALMDTLGKAFIFGSLIQVRGPDNVPYFVFLMGGMLGWRTFQRTVYITTRGFDRFSKLTGELHFPLLLVPIAATGQLAFEFGIYVALFGISVIYYFVVHGQLYLELGPQLLLAPLGILWALVLAWGIAMVTGPVNSRTRDVRHILRNVIPLWLYITPVVYPLDRLHGTVRQIAQLNPMAPVVELVKAGLLGVGVVDLQAAVWSLFVTACIFLGGVWFVSRYGYRVAGIGAARDVDDDEDDDALILR